MICGCSLRIRSATVGASNEARAQGGNNSSTDSGEVLCPEVSITCVDTVAKKAAFIQQVAATLKLPNLKGLHARVETLTEPFDVVCSRAFASLVDFTTWSQSALADDGIWMAMKGKRPDQELAVLPENVKVFHVEQLQVPGLDAERCIIWMRG